jgi:hypothetical protein
MATPPAERMRKMRAHKRGDHSLCNPGLCNPETAGIMSAGEQLEKDLRAERGLSAAELALAREIGRTVDELEELESHLYGRSGRWLSAVIEDLEPGYAITVVVDKASAELDRKRGTLARLLGEFRQYGAAAARGAASNPAPVRPTGTTGPAEGGGGGGLAAVRQMSAQRRRT